MQLTLPHHGSTKAPNSCVGLEKTFKAKLVEVQNRVAVVLFSGRYSNSLGQPDNTASQGEGFKEPAVSDQPSEERHEIIEWVWAERDL